MSTPEADRRTWLGVDRRALSALAAAFLLMDLRGQHFAKATATRPRHVMSPLFWVVGQCLTASAVASLVLFMRVDCWFFAFLGLSLSMIVIATTVLVEFNEVVLHPQDLEIIAPRPVSPQTYTAARFLNLLFYVALMYAALNILPLLLGVALRDSGLWFAPAYLLASLAGSLWAACGVVLVLIAVGRSQRLEQWKEILAWTQIILILILGYGAQLMFRDREHAVEVWAAFPPEWVQFLPSAWLAKFVDGAVQGPTPETWLVAGGIAIGTAALAAITVWRLARLYAAMQPLAARARTIVMPASRIGSLARPFTAWLVPEPAQRAGFYLCGAVFRRDAALRMRCLLPLNVLPAVVLLGVLTGQFANPMEVREPRLIMLPLLAVYSLAMAVPALIHNLSFSDAHEAAWLFETAPLARPADIAVGMCKAVQAFVVTPLAAVLGVVMWAVWGDAAAAVLHAGVAWALAWPAALAAVSWIIPGLPLSLPHARGSSLGPIALPLAAVSAVLGLIGTAHYILARSPWFYAASIAALLAIAWPLAARARSRFTAKAWEGR